MRSNNNPYLPIYAVFTILKIKNHISEYFPSVIVYESLKRAACEKNRNYNVV